MLGNRVEPMMKIKKSTYVDNSRGTKFWRQGWCLKTLLQYLRKVHCDHKIIVHIWSLDCHDILNDNDPRGLLFIASIYNQLP